MGDIMKDTFVKLQKLQGVIAKKYEIEDKIKDVPKDLDVKKELLEKTNKSYLELCTKENATKTEIENLKNKKEAAEKHREELEKSVETIVLSREYETVSKDIETAKNEEQKTRNDLMELQNKFDELQQRISIQEEIQKNQSDEVAEETAKKDQILSGLQKELDEVDAQVKELSEGIPDSMLFKFERIIRNKNNVGIVPIHGTVCEGCHMTLPLQFVNEVRKEDDVYFCPYCSRVLFYEEVEGAQNETFTFEQDQNANDDEQSNSENLGDFVGDDEFSDF
jgi:predicted  nucleic acid-binding Zn-ribbon protein